MSRRLTLSGWLIPVCCTPTSALRTVILRTETAMSANVAVNGKVTDPLGTGADYHYRTERNYFLHVERGRAAVRNHPLVEQGINRLIANLKLGDFQLDIDSGDPAVDQEQKDDWKTWTGETEGGRNLCDYEGTRNFAELSEQSFF